MKKIIIEKKRITINRNGSSLFLFTYLPDAERMPVGFHKELEMAFSGAISELAANRKYSVYPADEKYSRLVAIDETSEEQESQ